MSAHLLQEKGHPSRKSNLQLPRRLLQDFQGPSDIMLLDVVGLFFFIFFFFLRGGSVMNAHLLQEKDHPSRQSNLQLPTRLLQDCQGQSVSMALGVVGLVILQRCFSDEHTPFAGEGSSIKPVEPVASQKAPSGLSGTMRYYAT